MSVELTKLERREFEAREDTESRDLMLPAEEFDEQGRLKDLVDLFN